MSRSVVRNLLGLAWPVALARLGIISMGVVDVMVVGQFVPEQLPFQALAWSPTSVLMVGGIGLLTGVQVLGARAVGAGAPREAGGAFRRGLVVALVAGVLSIALAWLLGERMFTAFGIAPELAVPATRVAHVLTLSIPLHLAYVATAFFLESIQKPLASTIAMWVANALNLALNFVLVPTYGAVGSAWCTVAARVCLLGTLGVYVWRMADAERFGVKHRAEGPNYAALLKVGLAAAVSQAAEAGAFSGMTMLAGRLGADAVSTYQILLNLLALMFMISLGVSSATAVLTSAAVGKNDAREAARASFSGLGLNALLMLVAAIAISSCSGPISRAYTANNSLAALIAASIWLAALILLPDGGQVVAAAGLRARGDNWFPTASHLLSYALVMPALAYWLSEVHGRGVTGLMLAVLAASMVSYGVLGARLWVTRHTLPPGDPAQDRFS